MITTVTQEELTTINIIIMERAHQCRGKRLHLSGSRWSGSSSDWNLYKSLISWYINMSIQPEPLRCSTTTFTG